MYLTDLPEGHLEQGIGDAILHLGRIRKEGGIGDKVDFLGKDFYRTLEIVERRVARGDYLNPDEIRNLRENLLEVRNVFEKESMRRCYARVIEHAVISYAAGDASAFLKLWERAQKRFT